MAKKSPIDQALQVIIDARKEVDSLLSDPAHGTILLTATSMLDKIINRFAHLGGSDLPKEQTEQFPPITNFMGEEIVRAAEVKPEDLEPGEADRKIFVDKVEKLYGEITTIDPQGILNAYTLPEDVLVVRGVAKKAGVEGYEDKELTIPFIGEIVAAMDAKVEEKNKQAAIDADLKKLQNKSTPGKKGGGK